MKERFDCTAVNIQSDRNIAVFIFILCVKAEGKRGAKEDDNSEQYMDHNMRLHRADVTSIGLFFAGALQNIQ